jgi:hypothetical protein
MLIFFFLELTSGGMVVPEDDDVRWTEKPKQSGAFDSFVQQFVTNVVPHLEPSQAVLSPPPLEACFYLDASSPEPSPGRPPFEGSATSPVLAPFGSTPFTAGLSEAALLPFQRKVAEPDTLKPFADMQGISKPFTDVWDQERSDSVSRHQPNSQNIQNPVTHGSCSSENITSDVKNSLDPGKDVETSLKLNMEAEGRISGDVVSEITLDDSGSEITSELSYNNTEKSKKFEPGAKTNPEFELNRESCFEPEPNNGQRNKPGTGSSRSSCNEINEKFEPDTEGSKKFEFERESSHTPESDTDNSQKIELGGERLPTLDLDPGSSLAASEEEHGKLMAAGNSLEPKCDTMTVQNVKDDKESLQIPGHRPECILKPVSFEQCNKIAHSVSTSSLDNNATMPDPSLKEDPGGVSCHTPAEGSLTQDPRGSDIQTPVSESSHSSEGGSQRQDPHISQTPNSKSSQKEDADSVSSQMQDPHGTGVRTADFEDCHRGDLGSVSSHTPANSIQTPAQSIQTPANSSQTPANSIQTPANSSQTPANNSQTPANRSLTPAKSIQTPAKSNQTPANSSQTPAKSIQTHADSSQVQDPFDTDIQRAYAESSHEKNLDIVSSQAPGESAGRHLQDTCVMSILSIQTPISESSHGTGPDAAGNQTPSTESSLTEDPSIIQTQESKSGQDRNLDDVSGQTLGQGVREEQQHPQAVQTADSKKGETESLITVGGVPRTENSHEKDPSVYNSQEMKLPTKSLLNQEEVSQNKSKILDNIMQVQDYGK